MSGAARAPRDLAWIAAARLAVSTAVLLLGFRAVSDDDFSRVVIAQQLAASPRLDPSGTSWLPFPFWLNGAAMSLLGRSLLVARGVALLLGVASSALIALAAQRLFTEDSATQGAGRSRAPLLAGLLAALVGWSAWLGVATVPELFTASLTLFATASLAPVRAGSPGHERILGGLALLVATLSRYEPWPVAVGFAIWSAIQAAPRREEPAPAASRGSSTPLAAGLASLLAIAGPALWIVWNRLAHGDALHFVARVTAYRRALGDASRESTLARLAAYPVALAREMPEVVLPALLLVLLALAPRRRAAEGPLRAAVLASARACAAPLVLASVQIVALSTALVKDGAPTHHPERAVLFPALALVVFLAGVADAALPRGALSRRARGLAAGGALLLLGRAAVLPALARRAGPDAPSLWAHLVRQITPREAFIERGPEVEIGALAAASAPPRARIYIERVADYGYFAIFAGSGRPEAFLLAEAPDPRVPKPAVPPVTLAAGEPEYRRYLHDLGVALVIAPAGVPSAAPPRWGAPPLHRTAEYALWKVP